MSDYSQTVFFGPKDSLATGNAAKVIKGTEIDVELAAISTAIATKAEVGDIPSGQRIMFVETAAPSGWSLETGFNEMMPYILDSPTGSPGVPTEAGSWTVSGLTMAHTHSGTTSNAPNVNIQSGSGQNVGDAGHTHSFTTGAASLSTVASDATWRPAYVEVIVCQKD